MFDHFLIKNRMFHCFLIKNCMTEILNHTFDLTNHISQIIYLSWISMLAILNIILGCTISTILSLILTSTNAYGMVIKSKYFKIFKTINIYNLTLSIKYEMKKFKDFAQETRIIRTTQNTPNHQHNK